MERCELTDLDKASCAHCRGIVDLPVDRSFGPWFPARYEGRCRCGQRWNVGDSIRVIPGGFYEGECCA
jgi:hypothetical protein